MNAKEHLDPARAQAHDATPRSTSSREGGAFTRVGLGRLGMLTTLAAATAVVSLTSGCAWTLVSAADAVGSVTQAGFAVASQYSSPTYVSGEPLKVKHVCIEINNQVNLADLVPALRVSLASRGVTSMVYNAGTAPPDCEARLTYTASMDYGHREFSDGYSRYLSVVDLRLVHGTEVVVAHYQTEGLNTDRFATTSTKMRGLVRRMVVPASAADTQLAAVPISRSSGYTISTNGQTSYGSTEVLAVPMQSPGESPLPNPSAPVQGQANPYGTPANGYVSPYAGAKAAPAMNPPAYAATQPAAAPYAPYAGDAPMSAPATAPANPYGTTPGTPQPSPWKPKGVTATSP